MITKKSTAAAVVPMRERAEYIAALRPLQELERAHAEREATRAKLLARRRGEKSKRSVAERAADLVAGGKVIPASDDDLRALDDELAILRNAITEKAQTLDNVARELSYTASESVKATFDASMRDALTTMTQLAAAFRQAIELASTLARAGYRPSAVILPDLIPRGAWMLGDPAVMGSEAFRFRKLLEDKRIV
jgi:hypothetical protein